MSILKKITLTCITFLAAIFIISDAFAEEDKNWSLELDNTFSSQYVWRGINLVDNWVWQPSFTAGYKWVSINVWGNFEFTDENEYPDGSGKQKFTEVDYTLDVSHSWEKLAFSIGYAYYDLPNTGFEGTSEIYGGLGLVMFSAPTLTVYYDLDEAEGVYGSFSLSHTFEEVLKSGVVNLSVDLFASIAAADENHNEFYYGHDEAAFTDAMFSLGLPVAIGDYVTITPVANYSVLVDSEIADLFEDEDNFYGGVSLTIAL